MQATGKHPSQNQLADLYGAHHGWLHAWLRKKLGCTHLAADLSHDTFLRLLVKQELVVMQEPRAFLLTVAQRVLSNYWRREKIERAYELTLLQIPEATAPSPEERAILIETLLTIDQLLDGLPLAVKRAFLYSQLDGLGHAQIGELLGVSITTVKRYLVRAGTQCYFASSPD
ncbi:sigma-70 family RNA polymerase sigma factor [Methylobacillus arboreus]|uniref:sigma-70 family RNA polymerase sigma factor n=1 Tax=Methylobacillus arboreus TaxID=755170 RepID=UPI001E2E6590|nr:sigma-70 family RNA polymerase sigma factor [Methylobacillus arboreus]MCB5190769.1 sigma-70 family RNA polymerase sigma factor [Methylobacillus arboreus]